MVETVNSPTITMIDNVETAAGGTLFITWLTVVGHQLSRSRISRLEDRVDRSNYDYSKLKKKEGKESYSTRCS